VRITLDLGSTTPQYEQIRQQVAAHAAAGGLREGDRLPTVRALAADLGVAPGTVARAYRELEAGGVVATRRRVGTVVVAPSRDPGRTRGLAAELVSTAASEGVGAQELLDIVRSALLETPAGAR
jgi:GntR family transcriptional regulator